MSEIAKFDYEGHSITFEFKDGQKMVNATQMAKPFRKPVGNFLRLAESKKYIQLLETRYSHLNNGPNELKKEVLRVVQGGIPEIQGTWMDEKLALKFAAWLSPEFELWVYERIEELFRTGLTELRNTDLRGMTAALRIIADQIEQQDRVNQEVRQELDFHAEVLGELQAKITSIDESYYSISGYCSLIGIECPNDKALKWGRAASKLSKQKGIDIGKVYDPKFGEVNSYHRDILDEVFSSK